MNTAPYANATRELGDRFSDLVRSLSALRELSQLDVHTSDEGALVRRALEGLLRNQDFLRCSVFVLQGNELINRTGLDVDDLYGDDPSGRRPVSTRRFRLGEGMIGRAAASGEIQRCTDCRTDARFVASNREKDQTLPGSLICVPLGHGEEVLGVLNVSHPEPEYFTDWHERLLSVYCSVLGMLIMNSRLLHQLKMHIRRRTKDLEAALAETARMRQECLDMNSIDPTSKLHTQSGFCREGNSLMERCRRHGQKLGLIYLRLGCASDATTEAARHAFASALNALLRGGDLGAAIGDQDFAVLALGMGEAESKLFGQQLRACATEANFEWNWTAVPPISDLKSLIEQARNRIPSASTA